MTPQTIDDLVLRSPPLLRVKQPVEQAVDKLLETDLPALPVVDEADRYAGVFGEREFVGAVFPGYLKELRHAGFVPRSLDEALEKRETCRLEPVGEHMNTEHVDVAPDFSDSQVAEIFLHHRVLIVPIVDGGRVTGLITRHGFFRAVAERFRAGA
ncbi:MAG: CBS domain-containing protein [Actinomycetota bacterium]|nr:CBS domain-containing protein [Actinomycetota bacterium]MDQ5807539.1 CBS domain-containing protein [Actinomycetota bacterium]